MVLNLPSKLWSNPVKTFDVKCVTCGGSFVSYGTNVRQVAGTFVFLFLFCFVFVLCVYVMFTLSVYMMNKYAYIFLQGSVATRLRCSGIFSDRFIANFIESVPVKKLKSVNIWWGYGQQYGVSFFGSPCTSVKFQTVTSKYMPELSLDSEHPQN